MAEKTLKDATEVLIAVMKQTVLRKGETLPAGLMITKDGNLEPILTTGFVTSGDKESFAARVKAILKREDAKAFVMGSEAWMIKRDSTTYAPGVESPGDAVDRIEVLAVTGEDRDGNYSMAALEFVRDEAGIVVSITDEPVSYGKITDPELILDRGTFSGWFA